jgi:tetrahydromethanopterin S-methyltransferase subunit B
MAQLTGKVSNTVTPMLNSMVANSNNFAIVADMRLKILEVPNLSATAAQLLNSITPTTTPLELMQIVAAIETAVANT